MLFVAVWCCFERSIWVVPEKIRFLVTREAQTIHENHNNYLLFMPDNASPSVISTSKHGACVTVFSRKPL